MILNELYKIKIFLISLAALMLFAGCQKEYLKIGEPDTKITISANDSIAKLLLRIALKDGSFDNIIDGCNEISIQFPYSVKIKNETIAMNSPEDIQNLKFEYFQMRNDISINFPVTIAYSDYSEAVLSNNGELRRIQNQYNGSVEDDDIECIDFIYPVRMALYQTDFQKYDLIDVKDDMGLYNVFSKIKDMIVELDYPIFVESSDGNIATINNNIELENAIIDGINSSCDENDEIVFGDEDYPYDELIIQKEWKIFLFTDTINRSDLFGSCVLNFKKNNTIQLSTGAETFIGAWDLTIGENFKTLKIEFSTDEVPTAWLSQNWIIKNISPVLIEMEAESASGEYVNMFILKTFNNRSKT